MVAKTLDEHITRSADILGGKPCIAGRRIAVEHVATWFNELGMTIDAICQAYDLTPASVHAALAYYFDHQEEIDARRQANDSAVDALQRANPSVLRPRLDHRTTQHRDGE